MVSTRHESQTTRLKFREKLVGKGLSTDALLKKLKTLQGELAAMDQETVDTNSLSTARKELINQSIILHRDKGVKACAACCIADLLRLYAPDAPYNQAELRDIFQFFFKQLTSNLKGTDSPYFDDYFSLLESLSTVKSVVLVCDLPNADVMMEDIFRDLFIVARRDLPKRICIFALDILIALVDESAHVPQRVLEKVLAQFMDNDPSGAAYRLAVDLFNAVPEKLQRNVCIYFTDLIVASGADDKYNETEIERLHQLVRAIGRECPNVLVTTVPQLEEELLANNAQLRAVATQTLGAMFADKSGAELVRKHPQTWAAWLNRKNDKAAAIRLKFVETCRTLLLSLADMRRAIEAALLPKLLDPDEKVRAAVCKVYGELDHEFVLHYVSMEMLQAIGGRGVDKKPTVRHEALNCLGKLFNSAYAEIEGKDASVIRHFAWIPNHILDILAANYLVRAEIEQVMMDHITPLPPLSSSKTDAAPSTSKLTDVDEVAWTERVLTVMTFLDEKAMTTFLTLTTIKYPRPTTFDLFLKFCVDFNGGIMDNNEDQITRSLKHTIQRLSAKFPDPQEAAEDLNTFAKKNDNRLFKLLGTAIDVNCTLKSLVKAMTEFNTRLQKSAPSIASTLAIVLRRAPLRIVNQSSVPILLSHIQRSRDTAQQARTLLDFISRHLPVLYNAHILALREAAESEENPMLMESSLQALAAVARMDASQLTVDDELIDMLKGYALSANHRHAKFATRILAHIDDREAICKDIVEIISGNLANASPVMLLAHTAVLVETVRFVPDAFEHRSDVITKFLVSEVLMKPLPSPEVCLDEEDDSVDDEWSDEMRPEIHVKVLALKVYRYRCLAHASEENALTYAVPVLKLYVNFLQYEGSSNPGSPNEESSRMRLQSAISLLHLVAIELYSRHVSSQFVRLAVVVQASSFDSCYNVRLAYLKKVLNLIRQKKLPARYNVIPFLTCLDPEDDVKNEAAKYMNAVMQSMPPALRVNNLELIFIHFLHLLAHHPDFSTELDDLVDMAKCIEFYLDIVGTPETISLLYHIAMKGKAVCDAEEQYNENLYVLSELAQELIKARVRQQSWNLESYPGKVKMPPDILKPHPNPEVANEVIKSVYLPDSVLVWLAERGKPAVKV
ncbi:hypothetical protein FISHEDRAFT_50101 [Fistulina hepatica ATCC 64428]|uniref:ARM repeat-containing protein n=1 Tax=Fistulina hepatica ATCC 64428 TaxID=1128425 RepID=A0A0D7A3V3_9AGAR|nr:hypothetical protein FISHEDRAFT_50101 [Fistulina hepatica ATCC 64428]